MYAIGFIIDDSVKVSDLAKAGNLASALSSFLDVRTPVEGATYYVLKDVTPEIVVRVFVIVTRQVPSGIKSKIQATEDQNGIILPAPAFMWLNDGVDYPREEIERRLKLWVGEQGASHIWIVDINSNLTGDIPSKFIPL